MKKTNLTIRLSLIVGLLSFLAFLFYYPSLPQIVPIHWNIRGEADNTGHKAILLFLALLPLLNTGMMMALPRLDPKRSNYSRHSKAYRVFTLVLTLMMTAFVWIMVLRIRGASVHMERVLPAVVGLSFILLGNWMPQLRPNYFMGFRTPWALEDETVWRKTHRAGGVLFVASGGLLALGALLPGGPEAAGIAAGLAVGLLLAGCVGVYVYSYRIFKKAKKQREDENNA